MKSKRKPKQTYDLAISAGRALRRAAKVARKTARMHGTPICVVENGKIVLQKP